MFAVNIVLISPTLVLLFAPSAAMGSFDTFPSSLVSDPRSDSPPNMGSFRGTLGVVELAHGVLLAYTYLDPYVVQMSTNTIESSYMKFNNLFNK